MESQEEALCETCGHTGEVHYENLDGSPACCTSCTVRELKYHPFKPAPLPSPASTPGPLDLEPIRARAEAATVGPWGWRGQAKGGPLHLLSLPSPQYYVMGFVRHGMQGGQPVFRKADGLANGKASDLAISSVTYADRVCDIDSPDARFIAASRADITALIAEIERLRSESAR